MKRPTLTFRRALGLTMVELLVAIAMSLAFLTSAAVAFVAIMEASDKAERHILAVNNARAALHTLTLEISAARVNFLDLNKSFSGTNEPLPFGDNLDNDGDGAIDEEQPNGLDDDGDYVDQHVLISTVYERPLYVGRPDIGDYGVDEDVKFHQDRLRFYTSPDPSDQFFDRESTYFVGSFDGEDYVLLKTTDYNVGLSPRQIIVTEPIGFDVMSFNCLYFDANRLGFAGLTTPGGNWPPYYVEEWSTANFENFQLPRLINPVAVRIEISVYVGGTPLDELQPGAPIEVVTLSTVVLVEEMANSFSYDLLRSLYLRALNGTLPSPSPAPPGTITSLGPEVSR